MRATSLEYRLRFLLHAIIFFLGFWCPWLDHNSLAAKSSWLVLASWCAHHGWLTFFTATDAVLVIALAFILVAAWFRVWGSAYVGADVVHSSSMHGRTLLAGGPYRRTRNPLYLGTLLHTIGLSILMPVTGAIFTIALVWLLQIRLALAEEPFLAARFGQPYLDYKARVPRFLPSPTPLVASAGQRARWLFALLGEFYFVAVVFVLGIWGWKFNAQPLQRGVLISLGLWLVIRGLMPRAKSEPPADAQPIAVTP